MIIVIGEHEDKMISIYGDSNETECKYEFPKDEIKMNYSTITWKEKYLFLIGGTDESERYYN